MGTLRTRLFLVALIALLPTVAIILVHLVQDRPTRREHVREDALRYAMILDGQQEKVVNGARKLLAGLAQLKSIHTGDQETCGGFVERLLLTFPEYTSIDAFDLAGKSVCGMVAPGARSVAASPWFSYAVQHDDFAVGNAVVDGVPVIVFSYPVRDQRGAAIGILAATLDTVGFAAPLKRFSLPEGSTFMVADHSGVVLAASEPSLIGHALPARLMSRLGAPGASVLEGLGRKGTPRIFGYVPMRVGVAGLMVVVGIDKRKAFAEIDEDLWRNIGILVAGAATALWAAWAFGQRGVRRPTEALLEASTRLADGDYQSPISVEDARSEFGQLGVTLDRLRQALSSRETALRQAKEAAQSAARSVTHVLESTTDSVVLLDRDLRIAYVNGRASAQIGGERDLVGLNLLDAFPALVGSAFHDRFTDAVAARQTTSFDAFYPPRNAWFEVHAYPSEEGLAVFFRDITDRRRAEEEIRRGHRLLMTVIESTPDLVAVKDLAGRYLLVNSAVADAYGRRVEDFIGKAPEEVLPPEIAALISHADAEVATVGEAQVVETEFDHARKGRCVYHSIRTPLRDQAQEVRGIVSVSRDITSQKLVERELRDAAEVLEADVVEHSRALAVETAQRLEVEASLRQVQKMEALGQLTGGVAHDFNNFLTVISGNLELLGTRIGDEPRLQRLVAAASMAAARAERLTSQLLSFARKQKLDPQPLSLARILNGMEDLSRRIGGERVRMDVAVPQDLPAVMLDRNQLESAILNLVINARDAMPDGGTITITARSANIEARDYVGRATPTPGHYVVVSVVDSGCGMAPDVIERAVEPFFTTKEPGKGTGLGLSMVYGFVRQSGGHLHIASEPGRGTTISLYLPVAEVPLAAVPETGDGLRGSQDLHGSEVILVVEDEASVRDFTVGVLRDQGYTVLEAASGDEALQLLRRTPRIDLVFSDVVMPGKLSGIDLAEMIARERSDVKVALTSGYTDDFPREWPRAGAAEFVAKPYTPTVLTKRIREVLDRL